MSIINTLTFKELLSFSLLGIVISLVLFAFIFPLVIILPLLIIGFAILSIILLIFIFGMLYITRQLPDTATTTVLVVGNKEFYSGITQSFGLNGIVFLLLLSITIIQRSHDHYTLVILLTMFQFLYWIPIMFLRIIKREINILKGIIIGALITIPAIMLLSIILFYIDNSNYPISF